MAKSQQIERRDSPVAGLVLNVQPHLVKPREWITASNVRFVDGLVKKIPGWAAYAAPAGGDESPASLITRQMYADGTGRNILATGKWFYVINPAGTLTKLNAAAHSVIAARWDYDAWSENIYFCSLESPTLKLPGGYPLTETLGGGAPRGRTACVLESHLCLAAIIRDNVTYYGTWANSGLGASEDWDFSDTDSEANITDVTEGGDQIQRILRMGNYGVLCKEKSVHLLTYAGLPTVFSKQQLTASVGLVSPYGVVNTAKKSVVFAGQDDFYRLDGITPTRVGTKVWDAMWAAQNQDFRHEILAFENPFFNEVAFVYVASGADRGVYATAYVWNYLYDSWSTRSWPFTAFGWLPLYASQPISAQTGTIGTWEGQISAGERGSLTAFFANSTGAMFKTEDSATDTGAGADVVAELISGDGDLGFPGRVKLLTGVHVDAPVISGTNALKLYVSARMNIEDTVTWSAAYDVTASGRVDLTAVGKWFRFRFVKTGGKLSLAGYHPVFMPGGFF